MEAGYADVDSYVKTHFELLREDFLRPLREMVEKARLTITLTLPLTLTLTQSLTLIQTRT